MLNMLACCVTGHRTIPPERYAEVKAQLQREIQKAIRDGYTHFISGFAQGADLLFAQLVAEYKPCYAITLEAAIPYAGRMKTADETFRRLIGSCDKVSVLSVEYHPGCYQKRNRYMVDAAARVLAVYDGRSTGGTASTVRYAYTHQREVRLISL